MGQTSNALFEDVTSSRADTNEPSERAPMPEGMVRRVQAMINSGAKTVGDNPTYHDVKSKFKAMFGDEAWDEHRAAVQAFLHTATVSALMPIPPEAAVLRVSRSRSFLEPDDDNVAWNLRALEANPRFMHVWIDSLTDADTGEFEPQPLAQHMLVMRAASSAFSDSLSSFDDPEDDERSDGVTTQVVLTGQALRLAEVLRTHDREMSLTLGAMQLNFEFPPGSAYAEAFDALFALPQGLLPRLEQIVGEARGLGQDSPGSAVFQCFNDADMRRHLTAVPRPELGAPPPVRGLKENGMLGVHQFVHVAAPPGSANDRFRGNCARYDYANGGREDAEGCAPFRHVGEDINRVRDCMVNALTGGDETSSWGQQARDAWDRIVAAEWSHAGTSGRMPERESGGTKGPKSGFRHGTWTEAEFRATLPYYVASRILKRLSWAAWLYAPGKTSSSLADATSVSVEESRHAWIDGIGMHVGKTTALRGEKGKKGNKKGKTPPISRLSKHLDDAVLGRLSECVVGQSQDTGSASALVNSERTRLALRCVPVLHDIPGTVTNGISDDIASFVEPHHVHHSCPGVPSACGRMATARLLQVFTAQRFSMLAHLSVSTWTWNGRPPWDTCMTLSRANCRMFAGCHAKAMQRVCADFAECCPSPEVHTACRNDPGAAACKYHVCINGAGETSTSADDNGAPPESSSVTSPPPSENENDEEEKEAPAEDTADENRPPPESSSVTSPPPSENENDEEEKEAPAEDTADENRPSPPRKSEEPLLRRNTRKSPKNKGLRRRSAEV